MGHIERIINHLVIASSFTPNIGLYHGKMGIVIFLMPCCKRMKNIRWINPSLPFVGVTRRRAIRLR